MRAVQFSRQIALILGLLLGAGRDSSGEETPGDVAEKEAGIRQAAAAYVQALQTRNADALAGLWTEGGTFVDSTGTSTNARASIQELTSRSATPSAEDAELPKCESTIRLLTADAAIEEGRCTASGSVVNFVAVWVYRDGKWLLDHLNERLAEAAEPAGPLDGLAWMVGTWIGEGDGLTITCWTSWSENKNFLVRRIVVDHAEGPTMTATQRIGWDAATETIRSWTFNADGSVIKGRWLPMDDAWVVQSTGVLADKGKFSSVSFWIPEGEDRCAVRTSHVERDGAAEADINVEFRRVARSAGNDLP